MSFIRFRSVAGKLFLCTRYAELGSDTEIVRVVDTVDSHKKTYGNIIFFGDRIESISFIYSVDVNTDKSCFHKNHLSKTKVITIYYLKGRRNVLKYIEIY